MPRSIRWCKNHVCAINESKFIEERWLKSRAVDKWHLKKIANLITRIVRWIQRCIGHSREINGSADIENNVSSWTLGICHTGIYLHMHYYKCIYLKLNTSMYTHVGYLCTLVAILERVRFLYVCISNLCVHGHVQLYMYKNWLFSILP